MCGFPPVGTIYLWVGTNIPDGWVKCEGQLAPTTELAKIMPTVPEIANFIVKV